MANSDVQAEIDQLIAVTRQSDPRLHQALLLINSKLGSIWRELHPPTPKSVTVPPDTNAFGAPTDFSVISTGTNLRFDWTSVVGVFQYEIRTGSDWDSGTLVTRTTGLRAFIEPVLYGTYNYNIKSMSVLGVYSSNSTAASITVGQIPAVAITSSVIDNNVLLYWNPPDSTFHIKHYVLKRNGVNIGLATSTFATLFEALAGIYVYSITPVDIAGNVGTESTLGVEVNQPTDFDLHDSRISTLNGTRVNVLLDNGKLIANHLSTETWASHFTSHGWTTIQQQLDAGYPYYLQPASLTGSYEEIIDYGVLISSTIVTILYNMTQIAGSTTASIKMAVSADNLTYTPYVPGAIQFYASLRYLKFKFDFASVDDHSLAQIFNINTLLTVKRENDGGEVAALSTDVGGTVVLFNKPFKDIESITVSVKETSAAFVAIYDFVDVPNPTKFKVYVYTLAGARASKTVSWKARGII